LISRATKEFSAAQRLGRPGTPADQAWIESMFGHIKAGWPHLETIRDPALLAEELDRVGHDCNHIRLLRTVSWAVLVRRLVAGVRGGVRVWRRCRWGRSWVWVGGGARGLGVVVG
jgi:hypothetical protein